MTISRPIVIATCDWSKCGVKVEVEYSHNVAQVLAGDGWMTVNDRNYCCIEHAHEALKQGSKP